MSTSLVVWRAWPVGLVTLQVLQGRPPPGDKFTVIFVTVSHYLVVENGPTFRYLYQPFLEKEISLVWLILNRILFRYSVEFGDVEGLTRGFVPKKSVRLTLKQRWVR